MNRRYVITSLAFVMFASYTKASWNRNPWTDPYGFMKDEHADAYQANRHYYPSQSLSEYVSDRKYLQRNGIDIDHPNRSIGYKDEYGQVSLVAPLYKAVKISDSHLMKALLRAGADVNIRNSHNTTPLHAAICMEENYSTQTVEDLLDAGADASLEDTGGYTPLSLAVRCNKPDAVQVMLHANQPTLDEALDVRDRLKDKPNFETRLQGLKRDKMIELLGSNVWEGAK